MGFNDDILDIKYVPSIRDVDGAETVVNDHVVVATNSPQVRMFDLAGFSCTPLDGHEDIVLAVDASPDGYAPVTMQCPARPALSISLSLGGCMSEDGYSPPT